MIICQKDLQQVFLPKSLSNSYQTLELNVVIFIMTRVGDGDRAANTLSL